MALADYQTLVTTLVRDDAARIAVADRDNAIALAAERYGQDRPRTKVEDVNAPGGNLLDLAPGWQADFSKLLGLEVPIGSIPPALIAQQDRSFYQTPAVVKVQLLRSLNAATPVRWSYTIRHLLDVGNDTIPVGDREAVASYAAAILLDELAAFYSGETDSTIGADAVDHGSRAAEYAARAARLRKKYSDQLGLDDKRSVAAGAVVELDPKDSLGGKRLTHRLRR